MDNCQIKVKKFTSFSSGISVTFVLNYCGQCIHITKMSPLTWLTPCFQISRICLTFCRLLLHSTSKCTLPHLHTIKNFVQVVIYMSSSLQLYSVWNWQKESQCVSVFEILLLANRISLAHWVKTSNASPCGTASVSSSTTYVTFCSCLQFFPCPI